MKLIKDLGMLYPTPTSKRKSKFGIYECEHCKEHFKFNTYDVERKETPYCKKCQIQSRNNFKLNTKHRLYKTWKRMKYRCYSKNNPDYKDYGGRGIFMSKEWKNDFWTFVKDMDSTYQEGLEIDRINNDKGYSKNNCRWTDRVVQNRNTRKLRKNNTSGYRGVSIIKNGYQAQICVDNKQIYLGCFKDPIESARAYDKYIIDNNLEHTKNFDIII